MPHKMIRLALAASATFALVFPFHTLKSQATVIPANQSSALTIDAGKGIKAEISNYSVDGQQFSFTLTNLSSRPIIALGFISGDPTINAIGFTQVGADGFALISDPVEFNDIGVQPTIVTDGSGLAPRASASFCIFADYAAEGITINELFSRLLVLFSNSSMSSYHSRGRNPIGFCQTLTVSDLTPDRLCFDVTNNSPSEVITGIGFDLPDERGAFTLVSIDPMPQPGNQDLVFSASPGRVPGTRQNLDFALLTGETIAGGNPRGGVPGGSNSSTFCVGGDFDGLTPFDVTAAAVFRTQHGLTTLACLQGDRGLTGIVAGNPR